MRAFQFQINAGAGGWITSVDELPEDDVEHLDGLLRRGGLPPGDELAEVVEVRKGAEPMATLYSLSVQERTSTRQAVET
jgi:hypothetical protein